MTNQLVDQLTLQDNTLVLKTVFGEAFSLPNLTTLLNLYHSTANQEIKTRIYDILNHDLGTLLVVEIMIDANHEVTQKRLETGEISKNMKHVNDYYVIPKSHYALARAEYESASFEAPFEACHFAMFPYGLVIKRESFAAYTNPYTDCSILNNLLKHKGQ